MQKKMSGFRLYWRYLRLHALSGVQYKGWFFMIFQVFVSTITDPIATVFLFSRFGSIGQWSMERILLMYSLAVTCFGLAECFCRGFDSFPFGMIQNAGFDRVLLRPRSTYLQVAASAFHLHRVSRVISGLVVTCVCLWRLAVPVGPLQILYILYIYLSGLIVYSGVFVVTSGAAFFSVKGLDWIFIFTNASYQVPRVPVPYMPRPLYVMFTFLMPMLLISYYPASVLCGWGEPTWTGFLALPAALVFFFLASRMWNFGMRHYASAGS